MHLISLMFSDFLSDNYPLLGVSYIRWVPGWPIIFASSLCVKKTKAVVVAVLGTYRSEHGDRSL